MRYETRLIHWRTFCLLLTCYMSFLWSFLSHNAEMYYICKDYCIVELYIHTFKPNPSFLPCPWNLRSIGPSDFNVSCKPPANISYCWKMMHGFLQSSCRHMFAASMQQKAVMFTKRLQLAANTCEHKFFFHANKSLHQICCKFAANLLHPKQFCKGIKQTLLLTSLRSDDIAVNAEKGIYAQFAHTCWRLYYTKCQVFPRVHPFSAIFKSWKMNSRFDTFL